MTSEYDDIIHLPHHQSLKRSHMSMHDRAAQFSPFAALTGFDSAIDETGRLTDSRTELEEYGNAQLDQALLQLQELLPLHPEITITYFAPDDRKSGGSYSTIQGNVKKIDFGKPVLILMDGREIPLSDIVHMESSQFAE